MIAPIVKARVKQARQFFVFWIQPGEVRAFVQIAVMTGEREIFRRIFSAVLSRRDVFDVKKKRLKFLPQPAILATIFRTLPDELAQLRVHQAVLERMRRALAWRIPMSVLAWT